MEKGQQSLNLVIKPQLQNPEVLKIEKRFMRTTVPSFYQDMAVVWDKNMEAMFCGEGMHVLPRDVDEEYF